jgi:hypothetical protein
MIRLTTILLLALPSLALAQDQLPQPDYHRQLGDPEWLAQVAAWIQLRRYRRTKNSRTAGRGSVQPNV